MREFVQKKLIDPVLNFLKQGVTPTKLAWAMSAGIVIATVPAFGTCTILCLVAIWLFRLNPAAVLLTNQIAYPLQFLLYFPFLRSGEWLFNAQSVSLTLTQIFDLFQNNFLQAVEVLWWSTLYGITVWIILSIPIAYLIFLLLKFIFTRVGKNIEGANA